MKYILKPVIRARIDALNGAIRGTLDPGEAGVVVYAIQDQEAVTSTYSNESGIFFLRGLEPGSYTVSVDLPEESVFEDLVIENIEVIIGEVSELGTLNLTEK